MAFPESLCPWHKRAWEELTSAEREGRLGQVLLFRATPGSGLRSFAGAFCAHLLGLPQPEDGALLMQLAHPDFCWVRPEKSDWTGESEEKGGTGNRILAWQAKELCQYLANRAVGERKVAVIDLAEQLNPFAANALLKSLEEPLDKTHILLLSQASGRLLATIRSRCLPLTLGFPEPSEALSWLRSRGAPGEVSDEDLLTLFWLAGRAPFVALQILEDSQLKPLEDCALKLARMLEAGRLDLGVAESFAAFDALAVSGFCARWLAAAGYYGNRRAGEGPQMSSPLMAPARALSRLPANKLTALYDQCMRQRRMSLEGANPNQELLLATLLLSWLGSLASVP